MRPVVGITTYVVPATFGVWKENSALVPLEYVSAVERAGGRPLLVPPSIEGVDETLDALDGIIFSGGADLDPALYGQDAHPETDRPFPLRDDGEFVLLRAALERDMPTLGICRGSQVLNVAMGGTLVQHLDLHFDVARYNEVVHEVDLEPSSTLASWTGTTRIGVNSLHHQAVATAGSQTKIAGYATDGTIEAVEVEGKPVVGVQWHPELIRHLPEHLALFRSLVRLASS